MVSTWTFSFSYLIAHKDGSVMVKWKLHPRQTKLYYAANTTLATSMLTQSKQKLRVVLKL